MNVFIGFAILTGIIYCTDSVRGQGGGVAIPWGQGFSINMADFDPFASERRKPDGVIMDPHDPNNPTFATEPAVLGDFSAFGPSNVNQFSTRTAGGHIAASMPGDRVQSSRADFSSHIPRETLDSGNMFNSPDMWSRGSLPTFATSSTSRTGTKSRDSGGIAISLSGALPGNGMEDINSTFNDQTMYNNNDNSLHFNASDETGYNNSLQFNASALHLYVHDANVSASFNDTPDTNILQRVSSLAENPFPSGLNSMLGGFNESQFSTLHFTTNESRNNHSDTNEQIGLTESFALPTSSIDASFSDRTQSIHGTTFGSSNTLTDVLNFRESFQDNVTNMHNVTNDISLNNMANATEENAAALSVGDLRIINNSNQSIEFPPENLTTEIDSFTTENISIETFSHDNSNATAIDLTREMKNTFPSFNAPGLGSGHVERSFIVPIKRKVSIETDAASPNEKQLSNTLTGQSEKTLTLQQLYDRSHGGLQSTADQNNVGASNTALGGTLTAEHSGPSSPTPVNAWYTDNVQAGITKVVGSPITQDKPLHGTSGISFPPKSPDATFEGAKPSSDPRPAPIEMGVPIAFGFNMGSLPVEGVPSEPRPTDSVINEGTSSMNINTPLSTGASGVSKVVPGAKFVSNTQTGTLTQTDATINRNEQLPPVSMQSTSDPLQEPQRPIKLEPEPVVSRQPIIQTQPAVDFMSSFLSQPIDPTRRENRQQTVDITSNIDNTPVETARSVAPSQTLVQDAKSQDWNTFISSFLMGSAGFDQFGGQPSGPVEGPDPNQGSGSITPLQDSQSSNQKFAEFSPEPIASLDQGSPKVQTGDHSLEQVNILPLENTQPGGSGYAPESQLNMQNVRPDVVTYKENANPTERSQVVSDANLKNNPLVSGTDIPIVSKPVNTIDGSQAGRNTGYQVSMSSPNEMGNVIGFTGTRPLDTPQTAEITSVDTKITSAEPFKTAESNLALGLSEQPLTSFEGATASDLQKLKLLEVAQRLLLQERGIKDPQADSHMQTFTPQGMPGSIDNLLASLNQANSLADMIKKSLVQGQSIQTTVMPDTTTTTLPPRNIKLGEWSSGVAAGGSVSNERSSGVPIGNIFAGRFLQNGIGLPSVSGSPDTLSLDLTGGIPIGQSNVVDKPVDTSTSGAGGFSIVDKLAQPYQQECRAVKDPTSKFHFYRLVGAGRVRFRCALGTAFDEQTCQCSIIVTTHGNCLEVHMNFNNGKVEDVSPNQLPIGNEHVEVTNRTAVYPGIAVFNGNAKLTAWRYQNYDFRDHVMLQLRFRPGVGGDRYQPLIANCDGSPEGPSVGIIFDTKMNELAMVVRTDTNKDSTLRFRIDPNGWSEVNYMYDGNSFVGIVNNQRETMSTQGLVEISDEALVLGYCPRYGHFNGAIDDVKIYTCIPKGNRFLL